ncbi:MAG: hypothetical protein IMZ73_10065 [Chloroflexi bacterium]|nr:hypothetical protein [Chloroflexota bacterium]
MAQSFKGIAILLLLSILLKGCGVSHLVEQDWLALDDFLQFPCFFCG